MKKKIVHPCAASTPYANIEIEAHGGGERGGEFGGGGARGTLRYEGIFEYKTKTKNSVCDNAQPFRVSLTSLAAASSLSETTSSTHTPWVANKRSTFCLIISHFVYMEFLVDIRMYSVTARYCCRLVSSSQSRIRN